MKKVPWLFIALVMLFVFTGCNIVDKAEEDGQKNVTNIDETVNSQIGL